MRSFSEAMAWNLPHSRFSNILSSILFEKPFCCVLLASEVLSCSLHTLLFVRLGVTRVNAAELVFPFTVCSLSGPGEAYRHSSYCVASLMASRDALK